MRKQIGGASWETVALIGMPGEGLIAIMETENPGNVIIAYGSWPGTHTNRGNLYFGRTDEFLGEHRIYRQILDK